MIRTVDINSIRPDENQPRKIFDEKHIRGLAQSLITEGIINPIEVDTNNKIVTGECRWRAARSLGWTEVKININSSTLSKYERLRRQMAENVHQSGTSKDTMMNPIDTAKGYALLYKLKTGKEFQLIPRGAAPVGEPRVNGKFAGSSAVKEIAKEIGVSVDSIYDFLHILFQPKYVIEDILKGRPKSYYELAEQGEHLTIEQKDQLKKKIARGDYLKRDQIKDDRRLIKLEPDKAALILARTQAKESKEVNRILSTIAVLVLALEYIPFSQIEVRESGIVKSQLNWLQEKISQYLDESS